MVDTTSAHQVPGQTWLRAALVGLALALASCAPNDSTEAMESQGLVPPRTPVEPSEFTLVAIAGAKGAHAATLRQLGADLEDETFLNRLDSASDRVALEATSLQTYLVLKALAANADPEARRIVGELAGSPRYGYPGGLQAALLEASVEAHDPAPGLVELWRRELEPDASELMRTVDVLVTNGSAPAIAEFERALTENDYREDYVAAWLRDVVLRHRQDLPLLEALGRLIADPEWPDALKRHLVDVLFDYRPEAWYQIDVPPPQPPDRSDLSAEARAELLAITENAREQRLIDRRRARVIRSQLGDA